MDWQDRLASITANLDDLQAGVEGGSRAADSVRHDIATINGTAVRLPDGNVLASLTRHAKEVEVCASHQRGAMRELRQNIARLGRELNTATRGF
jgi:ribosomal protein L29